MHQHTTQKRSNRLLLWTCRQSSFTIPHCLGSFQIDLLPHCFHCYDFCFWRLALGDIMFQTAQLRGDPKLLRRRGVLDPRWNGSCKVPGPTNSIKKCVVLCHEDDKMKWVFTKRTSLTCRLFLWFVYCYGYPPYWEFYSLIYLISTVGEDSAVSGYYDYLLVKSVWICQNGKRKRERKCNVEKEKSQYGQRSSACCWHSWWRRKGEL